MKVLLISFLLFSTLQGNSQIIFPSDFHCENVSYKNNTSLMYNGKIRFLSDRLFDEPSELKNEYPFKVSKTKDNIYWGSGFSNGKYRYVLMFDELKIEVSSKLNDDDFSYYSTWILAKIRANLGSGKNMNFVDYKGNSPCND